MFASREALRDVKNLCNLHQLLYIAQVYRVSKHVNLCPGHCHQKAVGCVAQIRRLLSSNPSGKMGARYMKNARSQQCTLSSNCWK